MISSRVRSLREGRERESETVKKQKHKKDNLVIGIVARPNGPISNEYIMRPILTFSRLSKIYIQL